MNKILHESNPINPEFTLCGIAFDCNTLECEECEDLEEGNAIIFAKQGEKVTCKSCIRIIDYCKKIPRKYYGK